MKHVCFLIVLLSLLFVTACEKQPERIDDYFLEFATVLKSNGAIKFELDNRKILIPKTSTSYDGIDGQRVILDYTPYKADTVIVNRVTDIFTSTIARNGFPTRWATDPVKIQSVWVGGDHLNLIIEIEYHSKPHTIGLLRDFESSQVDLYFSHSRNDDPPGYPQKMYASFSLNSLRNASASNPIPFRFFINTDKGLREFRFELK
jgi:hypothetical protein